jgi:hypothetical protein
MNYGVCINERCELACVGQIGSTLVASIAVLARQQRECRVSPKIVDNIKQAAPKIYQCPPSCAQCSHRLERLMGPSHPEEANFLLSKVDELRSLGALD